jgi:AcrR family transcriptional regulator
LGAAAEVLAEQGLRAMTIEEVATRAGVGKATIYRGWSSKGTLALEAFLDEFLSTQPPIDTGSIEGDVRSALQAWVETVNGTTTGRSLVGLIAEVQLDPELGVAWHHDFVDVVRGQHRRMVDRAIARGELPRGSDVDIMMDLIYGPAYHRLMQGHLALNQEFVELVTAMVVAGAKAGAAVPRVGTLG